MGVHLRDLLSTIEFEDRRWPVSLAASAVEQACAKLTAGLRDEL